MPLWHVGERVGHSWTLLCLQRRQAGAARYAEWHSLPGLGQLRRSFSQGAKRVDVPEMAEDQTALPWYRGLQVGAWPGMPPWLTHWHRHTCQAPPPLLAQPLSMLPDRNMPSTLPYQPHTLSSLWHLRPLDRFAMRAANFCGRWADASQIKSGDARETQFPFPKAVYRRPKRERRLYPRHLWRGTRHYINLC